MSRSFQRNTKPDAYFFFGGCVALLVVSVFAYMSNDYFAAGIGVMGAVPAFLASKRLSKDA